VILNIRVIPKAGKNLIKEDNGALKAYLTKVPQDRLANKQLIELLSAYLKVKKYQIRIIKGEKSRNKVIEIDDAVNFGK
jgi:uncharacterized protein